MAITQNNTPEQLAESFRRLSGDEKLKLIELLPKDWFETASYALTDTQKKALDYALEKEANGASVFHEWEDVKSYIKEKKRG